MISIGRRQPRTTGSRSWINNETSPRGKQKNPDTLDGLGKCDIRVSLLTARMSRTRKKRVKIRKRSKTWRTTANELRNMIAMDPEMRPRTKPKTVKTSRSCPFVTSMIDLSLYEALRSACSSTRRITTLSS